MAKDNPYEDEIGRLRKTAAESRLRVIESQLALAFTLCAIAETEIRYSRPDEAFKVVNKDGVTQKRSAPMSMSRIICRPLQYLIFFTS